MDDRTISTDPGSVDPFARRILHTPYPWYRALGHAPVELTHPAVAKPDRRTWAVAGNDEVRAVLRLTAREHPRALAHIRPRSAQSWLEAEAARRADELVRTASARKRLDAVTDLLAPYARGLLGDLLSVPPARHARLQELAVDGLRLFGPAAESTRLVSEVPRNSGTPGWGRAIWAGVRDGDVTDAEADALLRMHLCIAFHATVSGVAAAIGLLAGPTPLRWTAARALAVFLEALRLETPLQRVGRTLTNPATIGGVTLAAGDRVLLLLGAANRDKRCWRDPDTFDLSHKTSDLVFGGEPDSTGRTLAMVLGRAMLTALARHVRAIELTGTPRVTVHNVVREVTAMPIELTAVSEEVERGDQR